MKQEIWTQMCPLSPYLLPWPDCCSVAVYGQNKARVSRVFIPVTWFIGFLARGLWYFKFFSAFYGLSSKSILAMNYQIINVSAFFSSHIETVSIYVILYFAIKKIMIDICYLAPHCVNVFFSVTFQFSYIQISTSVCPKAPQS